MFIPGAYLYYCVVTLYTIYHTLGGGRAKTTINIYINMNRDGVQHRPHVAQITISIYILACRYDMLCRICTAVQIYPRKHALDRADYTALTRQHELDHTDHTYHTDHTDQECIYLLLKDLDHQVE